MTKYICIEGGEGSYKTTTVKALADYYTDRGLRVLVTKEPGTHHLPVTMKLRELMLQNEYNDDLSDLSRELISQAIRSIHLKKLIQPILETRSYDLIIQDRGILSGIIYAMACKIDPLTLRNLIHSILADTPTVYDSIIVLNNRSDGLSLALQSKDEFGCGDAMESRGTDFHTQVNQAFVDFTKEPQLLSDFPKFSNNFTMLDVTGASTDSILASIIPIVGDIEEPTCAVG